MLPRLARSLARAAAAAAPRAQALSLSRSIAVPVTGIVSARGRALGGEREREKAFRSRRCLVDEASTRNFPFPLGRELRESQREYVYSLWGARMDTKIEPDNFTSFSRGFDMLSLGWRANFSFREAIRCPVYGEIVGVEVSEQ